MSSVDHELPEVLRHPLSRSAQLLLDSRIPARVAWVDAAGRPRVVALWFEWSGAEIAVSSFRGADKLADITDGSELAVSIDTDTFPYRGLRIRGPVSLEVTDGLTESYRRCAARYLGEEAGREWCARLADRDQVLIRIRPAVASETDLSGISFMAGGD